MTVLPFFHRWRCVVATMVALLAIVVSQARGAEEPPARITNVQFGFEGRMQPERWAPLRITIDKVNRPFSGTLVISYPQDHVQRATLRVPAAGSPGIATPIEATICIRANADAMTFTLLDEDDRLVDRLRYGNTAEDPDALPLVFDQREGMILCLGRVSPHRIVEPLDLAPVRQDYTGVNQPTQWSTQRMADNRTSRMGSLHTAQGDPLALPSNWSAYDTAEAMVIRTEELTDRISPASREAIMRWVQGGGRLILVVDQPGDLWRIWLPGNLASLITLADPQRVPIPKEWIDIVSAPDKSAHRAASEAQKVASVPQYVGVPTPPAQDPIQPDDQGDTTAPQDSYSEFQSLQSGQKSTDKASESISGPASVTEKLKAYSATFPVAASISARPITIATPLKHSGWRTQASSGPSLLAHGPVGFGYVTILTADPSLVAATPVDEPSRRVWLSVLEPGLQDWLALPLPPAALRQQWWGGWSDGSSGSDDFQRQAIAMALNAIADRPGNTLNPVAVLIALLVVALLLAVLLGPVDGVVLHLKRKLHLSWATALIWIAAISVLAGFTPWLVRGDLPTMRLSRSVEDVVFDHGGDAAWRTTVHGLFAAQPGSRQLLTSPNTLPSGNVFRGVAVGQYWSTSAPVFTPLSLFQSTTLSPRGSEQSIWPTSIEQGQWSLRNLLSVGPTSSAEDPLPIRARALRTGNSELRIEVEGTPLPAPANCSIVSSALHFRGLPAPYALNAPNAPGVIAFSMPISLSQTIPEYQDSSASTAPSLIPYNVAQNYAPRRSFGQSEDLPGIQRHDLAIEARIATGRWVLITLDVSIEIPKLPKGEPSIQSHRRTIRLLVPIEGSATPLTDSGATP